MRSLPILDQMTVGQQIDVYWLATATRSRWFMIQIVNILTCSTIHQIFLPMRLTRRERGLGRSGRLCCFVTAFRGFDKYPHAKLSALLREMCFGQGWEDSVRLGLWPDHRIDPESTPVFTDNKWSILETWNGEKRIRVVDSKVCN